MGDDRDIATVQLHIWAVGHSTHEDVRQVRDLLHQRCWPGGTQDHQELAAVPWLRDLPREDATPGAALPACTCADGGRCSVCN